MNRCFRELVSAIGPLEVKIEDAKAELIKDNLTDEEISKLESEVEGLSVKLAELHQAIKHSAKKPV